MGAARVKVHCGTDTRKKDLRPSERGAGRGGEEVRVCVTCWVLTARVQPSLYSGPTFCPRFSPELALGLEPLPATWRVPWCDRCPSPSCGVAQPLPARSVLGQAIQ